jgi:hypothetical protein
LFAASATGSPNVLTTKMVAALTAFLILSKRDPERCLELADGYATAPAIIGRSSAGGAGADKVDPTVIFGAEADRAPASSPGNSRSYSQKKPALFSEAALTNRRAACRHRLARLP